MEIQLSCLKFITAFLYLIFVSCTFMPNANLNAFESFDFFIPAPDYNSPWTQKPVLPELDLYLSAHLGKGISVNNDYYTIGMFFTPKYVLFKDSFLFFDNRLHLFNNGKSAANIGIGSRFFNPKRCTGWGLNAFYDYRQSHKGFNQLGFGLEFFENYFDLSINAYLSIHNVRKKEYTVIFNLGDGYIASCSKSKKALWGADFDIGTNLRKWCSCACRAWDVYAAGGIYFFAKYFREDLRGVRMRFGVQYFQYLSIEIRTTYDNIFHTRVQGIISFIYPFGGLAENNCTCNSCPAYYSPTIQPVQRQEIIVLGNRISCKDNW